LNNPVHGIPVENQTVNYWNLVGSSMTVRPVLCYCPTVFFRHIRHISFFFSARKNSRISKFFVLIFYGFKIA